jgi:hypothetical protein
VALGLALAWSALVRIPLVRNAGVHLDSDLAVDGITLDEALHGHWRWHYPGTPFTGTLPVLLSWPQAAVWGANPATLVSGGVVAQGLLTLAVFLLAWRGFGPGVAGWSLVPLTFASTGLIWLSGRITGGHLLTAAWHAGAFLLLFEALARPGRRRSAALGLWCGLGVYLDSMFVVTLAGLVPAAVLAWRAARWPRRGAACGFLFLLGFLAGAWPREAGSRIEPHDAYREQLSPVNELHVLLAHARMLVADCLPRLIVGHRLPELQADPDPRALAGPGPTSSPPDHHPAAQAVTAAGLTLFLVAILALLVARPPGAAAGAVRWGVLISAAAVVAGFVSNRNIYNSDNYRYLVTLVVPWALGFGLAMHGLAGRGSGGLAAAVLCSLVLAGLMTVDTLRWYARLGWTDERGRAMGVAVDDPVLGWLRANPGVKTIQGDYWDVYRLAFLTGGRVRGVPLPVYPDRFPEWSQDVQGGRPDALIVRQNGAGLHAFQQAQRSGGQVVFQARGFLIVSWR